MTITVTCPSCSTSFPVDPNKIPEGGVNARCSSCATVFFVEKPDQFAAPESAEPTPDQVTAPSGIGAESAGEDSSPAPETAAPEEVEPAPEVQENEDWVIEREPTMPQMHEEEVGPAEPFDTVESSQDSAYFGGPADDIETTEIPSPGPQEMADAGLGEDAEEAAEPEPHVTGGFEGGDLGDADFGDGDFDGGFGDGGFDGEVETAEAPDPDVAPPETPATPEADESSDAWQMGPPESGAAEEDQAETEEPETGRAPETLPEPEEKPQGFQFGRRDPHEKARRLARVLVSDMIMYHPERHSRALEQGSLQADFEDEIKKSWSEFVDQVGGEIAHNSSYFTDALNDILAKGEQIFHGQPGS